MHHAEFRSIFEEHAGFVWRVLVRHGVPLPDLEDACQDVFLVLYRSGSRFEGRSSMRTWLYGVAVRVALGIRRKARRRQDQGKRVDVEPEPAAEPFEAAYSRQLHQLLTEALTTLPRRQREVFVLYELEEMTIADAAAALGIPETTALYRLYAARDEIAAFVRKRELGTKLGKRRRPSGTEVA